MARRTPTPALLATLVMLATLLATAVFAADSDVDASFFDFSVDDMDGHAVSLKQFAHKRAILVVNVASACGYTDQNYRELQTLYEKYQDKGLEILAFPCNQFGSQEQGSHDQIRAFVEQQYHVTFPVFAKVDVNGAHAHPLFVFLKRELDGFITSDIKWNFTKFLIVDGAPFKRYATTTSPLSIEQDIVDALVRPEPVPDVRQEL